MEVGKKEKERKGFKIWINLVEEVGGEYLGEEAQLPAAPLRKRTI